MPVDLRRELRERGLERDAEGLESRAVESGGHRERLAEGGPGATQRQRHAEAVPGREDQLGSGGVGHRHDRRAGQARQRDDARLGHARRTDRTVRGDGDADSGGNQARRVVQSGGATAQAAAEDSLGAEAADGAGDPLPSAWSLTSTA